MCTDILIRLHSRPFTTGLSNQVRREAWKRRKQMRAMGKQETDLPKKLVQEQDGQWHKTHWVEDFRPNSSFQEYRKQPVTVGEHTAYRTDSRCAACCDIQCNEGHSTQFKEFGLQEKEASRATTNLGSRQIFIAEEEWTLSGRSCSLGLSGTVRNQLELWVSRKDWISRTHHGGQQDLWVKLREASNYSVLQSGKHQGSLKEWKDKSHWERMAGEK